MIDVKQAVRKATEYARELYEQNITDFLLEEVELSDNEEYWLITISFPQPQKVTNPLVSLTIPAYENRAYKQIKVRADNGQPVSMKIRKP